MFKRRRALVAISLISLQFPFLPFQRVCGLAHMSSKLAESPGGKDVLGSLQPECPSPCTASPPQTHGLTAMEPGSGDGDAVHHTDLQELERSWVWSWRLLVPGQCKAA